MTQQATIEIELPVRVTVIAQWEPPEPAIGHREGQWDDLVVLRTELAVDADAIVDENLAEFREALEAAAKSEFETSQEP